MARIEIVTDLQVCRQLWEQIVPRATIYDLWETRECFHLAYRRPPLFIAARDERGLCGLLPLSWIEESGCFGYFPGETWQGRTWLEQNRLMASDQETLQQMLGTVPGPLELRYLRPTKLLATQQAELDEWGYRFFPSRYDYDMKIYFRQFSRKTIKKIHREIASLAATDPAFRFDLAEDFRYLVDLNLKRFGDSSYFADSRFCSGFQRLVVLLARRGNLRMTTILVGSEPVAVDMGVLRRRTCTVLAGGTHGDFPGVAKLINIHHLENACWKRLQAVDFLCGDFSWKTLFHLSPKALYLLAAPVAMHLAPDRVDSGAWSHVN